VLEVAAFVRYFIPGLVLILVQSFPGTDGQEVVESPAVFDPSPVPAPDGRLDVDVEFLADQSLDQDLEALVVKARAEGCFGDLPPIGAKESNRRPGLAAWRKSYSRSSLDPDLPLVDDRVMVSTQNQKVREFGLSSIAPMFDVMGVADLADTARESAAVITMDKSSAQRWRNGAGPAADIEHTAIFAVDHDDATAVAGEASRRFS
jgi:hypothetical protein